MLQHHLKRGGAPVAACSGFDADAASAFLENVLSPSARSHYESHLAGCPACRRHVIELSQLFESFPLMDIISAPATQPQPFWLKGKSVVSEWLDFSQWRWNWRSVGLAGAAMTVLIAAISVPVWRQTNRLAPNGSVAKSIIVASDQTTTADVASPEPQSVAETSSVSAVSGDQHTNANFAANPYTGQPSATPNIRPDMPSPNQPMISSLKNLGTQLST